MTELITVKRDMSVKNVPNDTSTKNRIIKLIRKLPTRSTGKNIFRGGVRSSDILIELTQLSTDIRIVMNMAKLTIRKTIPNKGTIE